MYIGKISLFFNLYVKPIISLLKASLKAISIAAIIMLGLSFHTKLARAETASSFSNSYNKSNFKKRASFRDTSTEKITDKTTNESTTPVTAESFAATIKETNNQTNNEAVNNTGNETSPTNKSDNNSILTNTTIRKPTEIKSTNEGSLPITDYKIYKRQEPKVIYTQQQQEELNKLLKNEANLSFNKKIKLAQKLNKKNFEHEAARILEDLVLIDSSHFLANFEYGRALTKTNNPLAPNYLRKAIKIQPENQSGYLALIESFNTFEDKKLAVTEKRHTLEETILKFGVKKDFIGKLCKLYFLEKYFDETKRYCYQAIQMLPNVDKNYILLSLNFQRYKKIGSAKKAMKMGTDRFKNSEMVQSAAGQLYYKLKDYKTSEKYFEKAHKLNPKSLYHINYLAKIKQYLNKFDEALPLFTLQCNLAGKTSLNFVNASGTLLKTNFELHQKYRKAMAMCSRPSNTNTEIEKIVGKARQLSQEDNTKD